MWMVDKDSYARQPALRKKGVSVVGLNGHVTTHALVRAKLFLSSGWRVLLTVLQVPAMYIKCGCTEGSGMSPAHATLAKELEGCCGAVYRCLNRGPLYRTCGTGQSAGIMCEALDSTNEALVLPSQTWGLKNDALGP